MGISEMLEKASGKSEMSELVWASNVLQERIAPPGSAAGKMERIALAAAKLRWKFSRAKGVWYAEETVALRPRELRRIEEVSGVTFGRQELRSLNDLIAKADALLDGPEADFHRPFVDAFRAMARALNRTGTEG